MRSCLWSDGRIALVAQGRHPQTRSEEDRRLLAGWATTCAHRVLPFFEAEHPTDSRPRNALDGAVAWINDEIRIGVARSLAFDAHAAAREATAAGAVAAARAAGHAAATAHMAGHARKAADYALKAVAAGDSSPDEVRAESEWQRSQVPATLERFVYPD